MLKELLRQVRDAYPTGLDAAKLRVDARFLEVTLRSLETQRHIVVHRDPKTKKRILFATAVQTPTASLSLLALHARTRSEEAR